MSAANPVQPDAPPAYSPPGQEYQQQQYRLQQEEQYKLIQQYQQRQQTVTPASPSAYGTYSQGVIITPPVASQQIIVVGGCPACRVGVLEDDFSLLGICCAIVFFPAGLLCCLLLREKRCSNCGAVFG